MNRFFKKNALRSIFSGVTKTLLMVATASTLSACGAALTVGDNMKADLTSALTGPRAMVQGQYVHRYHDMQGQIIARDQFTYQAIGNLNRNQPAPKVGLCFYPTDQRPQPYKINGYPVRAGFVEGPCEWQTEFYHPREALGAYPSPMR